MENIFEVWRLFDLLVGVKRDFSQILMT